MTEDTTHTVVFTPSGRTGRVPTGTTVLAAARRLGVDIDSVCGGRGICGRCQVVPVIGDHAKWGVRAEVDHLSPRGPQEENYRGRRPLGEQRLGCAAAVEGDIVIDVPAESQLHKPVVRKEVRLDGLVLDPVVTLHYLDLPTRDEEDGTDALTIITEQLTTQWDKQSVTAEPQVLAQLHRAVERGSLTVALRHNAVAAVWPGFVDQVVGAALDIGSTTIAGHLCDLTTGEVLASAGRMNPQIRYGEDLMSRVSYAMLNEEGASQLTTAITGAVGELIDELLAAAAARESTATSAADSGPAALHGAGLEGAGLDRSRLLEVVAVGNPIMHHLLLGLDPTPLGQAPFRLAVADPVEGPGTLIGLDLPAVRVHVGPCIAGHVGADTAAAILDSGPHRAPTRQLLVDVGTNAEIVLGSSDGLLAASSPTGPAFEGAQISAGQRATAGAVERVRVDRATLEPRFKVIGVGPWSDEDGFTEAVAATGITGICGSGIIEVVSELFLAGVIDAQGVIVGAAADRSHRVVADNRTFRYELTDTIAITQNDVRAIQLAKAALRAGIELLMSHVGTRHLDEIRLAGAFGAQIDPVHAMVLGLIPDCPVGRVEAIGNAAGSGAVRALLSAGQRQEMAAVAAAVTKIETATEPGFQDYFVAALAFPHRDAPSPHLESVVDLPARSDAKASPGGRRGRRRRPRSATNGDPAVDTGATIEAGAPPAQKEESHE